MELTINVFEGNGQKEIDYILHDEGRVTKVDSGYQYEYFLKDHLGNTRVLFTDQAQTTVFAATMEAASADYEEQRFSNIENTRQLDKLFNHTEAGNHAALLNAAKGRIIGPATALKVMPGDTIKMKTFAKYLEKPKNIKEMTAHLGTAVAGAFGYVPGREQTRAIKEFFEGVLGATGLITPSDNKGVPKAYINYLFFDKNMALKSHGFRQITEAARGNHEELTLEVGVQEEGYMYIYTANETNADVDVYFDDVEIMQVHSEILATYDYYPFGLTFDDPIQQVAQPKNLYLYNGKEFQEETEWYDFGARMYDPVIGRFPSVDPLASKYPGISPYAAFNNNPVYFVDPDGRENIPALLWALKNMANEGIVSNYSRPWFGPAESRWTYDIGTVPTRSVCYESCFMAYMNSGEDVLPTLRTGFTNSNNAFKGRSHPTGGMNWFKAGDGTTRQFVTDINKGELGDIVFMGDVGDMEGHAVLLAGDITMGTTEIDGETYETASFYTLSTSSDTDQGSYGGREFTFIKQSDGTWKQKGGAEYTFRGYGQMTNIDATEAQRQEAAKLVEEIK